MDRKNILVCIFVIVAIAIVAYITTHSSKENYDHSTEPAQEEVILIPKSSDEVEDHHDIEMIPRTPAEEDLI